LLKRRCRIVNENISEEEIETMLDEGKTQMFNASILEDTTKAREQLNELKGKQIKLQQFVQSRKVKRMYQPLFPTNTSLVVNLQEVV
jgi:hypothetical protein